MVGSLAGRWADGQAGAPLAVERLVGSAALLTDGLAGGQAGVWLGRHARLCIASFEPAIGRLQKLVNVMQQTLIKVNPSSSWI